MVLQDYMVEYEGVCNPAFESCFTRCEDEACEEPSYHTKVSRYAPVAIAKCGENVSDCGIANLCSPQENECFVEFCTYEAAGEDEFCTGPLGQETSPVSTDEITVEATGEEDPEALDDTPEHI